MKYTIVCLLLASLSCSCDAQVILRTGDRIDEPVVGVNESGVRIGGQSPRVLSWDRVKLVEGAFADPATSFVEISNDLWRARIRLARGDAALAYPIYRRYFERYKDGSGETTAMVALGTLACAVADADHDTAFHAWLIAAQQIEAGHGRVAVNDLNADRVLIDTQTLVCPALPPVLFRGIRGAVKQIFEAFSGSETRVSTVVDMYHSGDNAVSNSSEAEAFAFLRNTAQPNSELELWQQAWVHLESLSTLAADADRGVQIRHVMRSFEMVYLVSETYPELGLSTLGVLQRACDLSEFNGAAGAVDREWARMSRIVQDRTGLAGWQSWTVPDALIQPTNEHASEGDAG